MRRFFYHLWHLPSYILVLPILLYQKLVSPLLPDACLYYPSCSHYSKDAILRHGALKGLLLAVARILRCNNLLFDGGHDPVPRRFTLRRFCLGYRRFWRFRRSRPEDSGR